MRVPERFAKACVHAPGVRARILIGLFAVVLIAWTATGSGDRWRESTNRIEAYALKLATQAKFRAGNDLTSALVPTVTSSAELAAAVGVNVHLTYERTPYRQTAAVVDALRYLGVTRVRDYAPERGRTDVRYDTLAAAGIRFDLFVPDQPSRVDAVDALERHHKGAVAAIEGPNEINNFPVQYDGRSGLSAARALQSSLFRKVRARPALADKPVYMFTGYPVDASADVANIHAYTHRGDNPVETLLVALMQTTQGHPRAPFVVTETGYFTAGADVGWGGVTPADQARLELEGILDAVRLGARAVYLYELLDGDRDQGKVDQEHHFGLFDADYHPKPAAVALHNLMADLKPHTGSTGCAPRDLRITGGTASWLRLRDQGSPLRLVVWRGPRDLARTGRLDLDLGGRTGLVHAYHPLLTEGPDGPAASRTRLSVTVDRGPVLVEIGC